MWHFLANKNKEGAENSVRRSHERAVEKITSATNINVGLYNFMLLFVVVAVCCSSCAKHDRGLVWPIGRWGKIYSTSHIKFTPIISSNTFWSSRERFISLLCCWCLVFFSENLCILWYANLFSSGKSCFLPAFMLIWSSQQICNVLTKNCFCLSAS